MASIIRKIPVLGPIISDLNTAFRVRTDRNRLLKVRHNNTIKIVVGASGHYQTGWTPTDVEYLNLLKDEDWAQFFNVNSIDTILAEHVWEHLTPEEGILAAQNCYTYLKSGGFLRIAVPDGYNPDKDYINYVKPGGTGDGADDHKLLYDIDRITNALTEIGYRVQGLEYFNKEGQFNFNDWEPTTGMVARSKRFDPRNKDGKLAYTSLIIDAIK